jgi:hypothetical protein
MRKNYGQTLIEFVLVFVVLMAASAGAFGMYKSVWKAKYKKMGMPGNVVYDLVSGGYVK